MTRKYDSNVQSSSVSRDDHGSERVVKAGHGKDKKLTLTVDGAPAKHPYPNTWYRSSQCFCFAVVRPLKTWFNF